ncbi:hypothetical protein Hanom_Chr10g00905781 [Helianthus anomalus]
MDSIQTRTWLGFNILKIPFSFQGPNLFNIQRPIQSCCHIKCTNKLPLDNSLQR